MAKITHEEWYALTGDYNEEGLRVRLRQVEALLAAEERLNQRLEARLTELMDRYERALRALGRLEGRLQAAQPVSGPLAAGEYDSGLAGSS
jgi:alkylhydroperoxidase family enzyme